jgi:hypothetical protein
MIPDGEHTAVLDRFEDDLAVLEVTAGDEQYELVVDSTELPADARHADAVLQVTVCDGELDDAVFDAEVSRERKREAQSRFDRLSERLPRDDDAE